MNTMTERDNIAWYRQFWPWFLISFPLAAVLAGVATFWIAARNPDGLVEDDYYKKGLAINRTLDRDRVAAQAGLTAQLRMTPQTATVLLHGRLARLPDRLLLRILHPTRAGMDQQVVLTRTARGDYAGAATLAGPGKWHVLLQDEGGAWRLLGEWQGGESVLELQAAAIE